MSKLPLGPVSLTTIPRRAERAGVHRVGGQLLATTSDGALHSFEHDDGEISEVGERIVELVDGQRAAREIAAAIAHEFDVAAEVAERDVVEFINLLVTKRILAV